LNKSSVRWHHVSMPEGCPWRIYRDQVTSFVLYCDRRLNIEYRMSMEVEI
jgi:hypothetical protein